MPDSPTVLADVARTYPFPIAFALREAVLDAPDDERRVRGIVQTFTLGIQYAALICAGEYARADYRDEQLSWSLESLKRPLVSHFANFVRAALKSLRTNGVTPLAAELADFSAWLDRTKVPVPVVVDDAVRENSLPVAKALEELRNTLAHRTFHADWTGLVASYLPHLTAFLDALGRTARYPLLRLVDGGRMVRLTGAATTFPDEPLPDAALPELARAQRGGQLSGLLLADAGLTRFLSLYPLVLMEPCAQCQAEPLRGLTEEVFLFNGDEGPHLVYLGVRHGWNTEKHRDAVDDLYERKKVAPPVIGVKSEPRELAQRARRQAGELLEVNRKARRYLPQLYQARPEMETALRYFLDGRRVGFCLLGEAGIGKTSLLCRMVEEWGDGDVVLFYGGRGLLTGGGLETRVLADLYLKGGFPELLDALREKGRRLILVIDGVNEDDAPHNELKGVCDFVRRHAAPPSAKSSPLKVVFSYRSAFFPRALQALGYKGDGDELPGLFHLDAFQTRDVQREGRREETYRFELERMTTDEAGRLYESYRGQAGFQPLTRFADVGPPAQRLLASPSYVRMAVESYDGRRVPAALWSGELLEAFARAKVYGRDDAEGRAFESRAEFADELVRLLRREKTDVVQRGGAALSPPLERAMAERQPSLSPYLQLVDEGVLMEVPEVETSGYRPRTRFFVRFALDPMFEYLLSEDVLRQAGGWNGLSGERLAVLLDEAKGFKHLTAAVELLLTRAAQEDRCALLAETLRAAERWRAEPVVVRVLLALEEMRHAKFEPLLDALAGPGSDEKSLTVFNRASYYLNELQRFRPAVACLKRAEVAGSRLVHDEGRAELANDLAAALMNKGNALQGLGRLAEAVGCYDEAIAARRRLVHDEGRAELANDLAAALMNKGNALLGLGRPGEALGCYDEAIAARRRLVHDEGRAELANDLALALMNKGNALQGLGRLAEAVGCYDEAIAALRRLVHDEGRAGLDDLARALVNKGNALDSLGRPAEAVGCYDEGIAALRRLVHDEGRAELADDLARALMNKGVPLGSLGRPAEAVGCYDEAIAALRRLVHDEGRAELANDLARVLLNKGNALQRLGRLDEAVGRYEEAIAVRRRLVHDEGRAELADDLARALMNKALLLEKLERWEDAFTHYEEAIRLREGCLQAGMTHLLPDLLKTIRYRLMTFLDRHRWAEASADVIRALEHAAPALQTDSPPAAVVEERAALMDRLRQLVPKEREQVFAGLGDWWQVVEGELAD
jgi:tetratricopeptide (TPR) repeat protein